MQLRLISATRALQGWEAVGPPERVFREEAGAQQGLSPLLNHSSLQRGTDVHGLPPLGYNSISSPLFLIFVVFFSSIKPQKRTSGGAGRRFTQLSPSRGADTHHQAPLRFQCYSPVEKHQTLLYKCHSSRV